MTAVQEHISALKAKATDGSISIGDAVNLAVLEEMLRDPKCTIHAEDLQAGSSYDIPKMTQQTFGKMRLTLTLTLTLALALALALTRTLTLTLTRQDARLRKGAEAGGREEQEAAELVVGRDQRAGLFPCVHSSAGHRAGQPNCQQGRQGGHGDLLLADGAVLPERILLSPGFTRVLKSGVGVIGVGTRVVLDSGTGTKRDRPFSIFL